MTVAELIARMAQREGVAKEVVDLLSRGDGSIATATDPLRTGKEGLLCDAKDASECLDHTDHSNDGDSSELDRMAQEGWKVFLKEQRKKKQKQLSQQTEETCRGEKP